MRRQSAKNAAFILLIRCIECDHGELITAQPGNDVRVPECSLQGARRTNNCEISLVVPKLIVDLLQSVYIGEEQQKTLIIPRGHPQFLVGQSPKGSAVVKACKVVE